MSENFDVFTNKISHDIFLQKYSLNKQETWSDTCKRVVDSVCGQLLSKEEQLQIFQAMYERKFIPGGRYLYSSGRPLHQVNNCFLFRAEDSREGWADAMQKATAALMTGGGIGFDYSSLREEGSPIKRTGGVSTGSVGLMNMVNESGRYIMQGGQRRSAIWAGLNWSHGDIQKFLKLKDWSQDIQNLKSKDFNFPVPMELTNISVIYDTEFFIAIEDNKHPKHKLAKEVWNTNCKQAFSTAEPGMSFNFRKDNESLRNACLPGFAFIQGPGNKQILMSEVKENDIVFDGKGHITKVLKRFNNGLHDVYSYVTEDGSNVFCTEDHKVVINKNTNDKLSVDFCYQNSIPVVVNNCFETKRIINRTYIGKHIVYDIMVDSYLHSYISGGVAVSNCTEVVSEDDSDKCNLGTIWINRIKDKDELAHITRISTKFLICGGIYSDTPNEKIKIVGDKNNRIGLGLGGIHEWLMERGCDYVVTPELHSWLSVYEQESDGAAFVTSRLLGVSIPKGVRAIAPTGTIGMLSETSTGIEPLFCKAYKRRYLKEKNWVHQYVIDGSVKRMLAKNVPIEKIKDSYDLTFKQRVKFQADVQNYVDMAISSTCNLPAWGSETNNEETLKVNSKILLKYAKRLRGFTCYPDGSRQGQPLTRVDLQEALSKEGVVFEEVENQCINGVCGL